MNNRSDLRTSWHWELLREEKKSNPHAMQAAERIQAEIARRNQLQKKWDMWIGIAGIIAFGVIHLFSK